MTTPLKLGGFIVTLAAVVALTFGVSSAVGPIGQDVENADHSTGHDMTEAYLGHQPRAARVPMDRRIDTVVLDKTGTVTTGRMTLIDTVTANGEDTEQLLRLAGALENASEHPIARAIAKGATEQVGDLPAVEDFSNLEGLGVQGIVADGETTHAVLVGRPRLLADWSQHLTPELEAAMTAAAEKGQTAVPAVS